MPDVPASWAAALERLLGNADPDGVIVRYVLAGEPDSALAYVSEDPAADGLRHYLRGRLGRWPWRAEAEGQKIADLYAGVGEVDAAVLRRWGRVLDAAGPHRQWGFVLGDLKGCHWPEALLAHAGDGARSGPLPVTFADLERIAARDGASRADLVRMAFPSGPGIREGVAGYYQDCLRRLPGLAGAVASCPGPAGPAFASGSAEARLAVLSLTEDLGDAVTGPLAWALAEAATSASVRVRGRARPLLARAGGDAAGPLRALAAGPAAGQRARALELLAELPGQLDWARATAAADRSASVRALVGRCDDLAAFEAADRAFSEGDADWIVAKALVDCPGGFSEDHPVFGVAAMLPVLPERLASRFYAQATGAFAKCPPGPAQAALARDPDRAARAARALGDRKPAVRRTAAEWLARIAGPGILPSLRDAWEREEDDGARGALLDALAAAGEDPGAYLTPGAAAASADRLAAAGRLAGTDWLDWASLPRLSWARSGEPVPEAVARSLCAIAIREDAPAPTAIVRHYAPLFDRASRERLAPGLLAAWLKHSSGRDGRGLLAAVAVCGGPGVAPLVERALEQNMFEQSTQHRNYRLLRMLARTDHPSAVRLLVSLAGDFRARIIRTEARRQLEIAARREGRSAGDLEDQFIPSAGFGADGILELSYGPRAFTAVLGPGPAIALRSPDGRPVTSLPAPRRSDDAARVRESKAALAAARAGLRNVVRVQTRRLREAMGEERSWAVRDWERLLRHPVAGLLARRVVWTARGADGTEVTFRPLADGTLTDADDNDVRLTAGARVTVASVAAGLSPAGAARWGRHLADYDVVPLFPQFETESA